MFLQQLNEGDLFILNDGVASDVYRKLDAGGTVWRTAYMSDGGWIPYARAERLWLPNDSRVKRIRLVLVEA